MKHIKKMLFLLACIMAFIGFASACDNNLNTQELQYRLFYNGAEYEVVGIGTVDSADIMIPATYKGKPVSSIRDWAFDGCKNIKNVTIPSSITSIGYSAFYDCDYNLSITWHYNPEVMRGHAWGAMVFREHVTTVIFPDGMTSFERYALNRFYVLKNLEIPSTVISIGESAFESSGLTDIAFPKSVTHIGASAFSACIGLRSALIPSNVANIDMDAFYFNNYLTIYAESASKPGGWHEVTGSESGINSSWNSYHRPVVWNCTLSSDKTYVVSVLKSENSITNPNAENGVNAPKRTGYKFQGWSTTQGGIVADYTPSSINFAPNGTTLYAIWESI